MLRNIKGNHPGWLTIADPVLFYFYRTTVNFNNLIKESNDLSIVYKKIKVVKN